MWAGRLHPSKGPRLGEVSMGEAFYVTASARALQTKNVTDEDVSINERAEK